MKKIRLFLWDTCDYAAGHNARLFVACAWLLSVLGCNYWKESADYLQRGKA